MLLGVPKNTLRLNDSLEGLTGIRKALLPKVAVYCSKRIQNKTSKGERRIRQSAGETSFQLSCPSGVVVAQTALTPLATLSKSAQRVLPTKETPPSLGVQGFY